MRLSFVPLVIEWFVEWEELELVEDDQLEPLEKVTELLDEADLAEFQKRPTSELFPPPAENEVPDDPPEVLDVDVLVDDDDPTVSLWEVP